MELKVTPIAQNGQKMYSGTITVKDLFSNFNVEVDMFSRKNQKGYQRKSTQKRARAFLKFVVTAQKAISPNSVLLNYRQDLKLNMNGDGSTSLEFPPKATLWIVDGQHRLRGLKDGLEIFPEQIEKFEIPFIIMNEKDQYLEALQFFIINKTHKGVKSDLAQTFLLEVEKKELDFLKSSLPRQIIRNLEWNPKALMVMRDLNSRVDSPWFNKIQLPNEPKLKTVVPQTSFIDSLEPIFKDDGFMISIGHNEKTLSELLFRYWEAIKTSCFKAFEDSQNYVIQKTPGIFALHKLFVKILTLSRDTNNRITSESIYEVIKRVPSVFNSDYWLSKGPAGIVGTNKKAFSYLAKIINEEFEKIDFEIKVKPFEL